MAAINFRQGQYDENVVSCETIHRKSFLRISITLNKRFNLTITLKQSGSKKRFYNESRPYVSAEP